MFSLIAKLYSSQDMPNSSEGRFHLGNESNSIINDFVNTTNADLLNTDKELYFNITSSTAAVSLLYQTVEPNYAQQALYKVQTLQLPSLSVDTAYICKYIP